MRRRVATKLNFGKNGGKDLPREKGGQNGGKANPTMTTTSLDLDVDDDDEASEGYASAESMEYRISTAFECFVRSNGTSALPISNLPFRLV